MRPIVFSVFGYGVLSYTFFMFLGFASGMTLAIRRARREALDVDALFNLMCIILAGAVIGSRGLFVIEDWHVFAEKPLEALRFWTGGLSFYGGLVVATAGGAAYVSYAGLPLARTCDLCAPYLALGHAFGKVGCLLAGCCYGALTTSRCGVKIWSMARDAQARHPAQIYEFAGLIVLFLVLAGLRDKARGRAPGAVFGTYLVGYGSLRLVVEGFRDAKMIGPPYAGMGLHQWASVAAIIAGTCLLIRLMQPAMTSGRVT